MNRTFLTSDQHFFHKNIIEYCNRPFETVEEMNETLIQRHNAVVRASDKVYMLGDFGFGSKTMTKEVVSRLNGHLILIMGNHDKAHGVEWWRNVGFNEVYKHPIVLPKFNAIFSHEPLLDLPAEALLAGNFRNFHGHIHNRFVSKNEFFINVGVDVHNFYPTRF